MTPRFRPVDSCDLAILDLDERRMKVIVVRALSAGALAGGLIATVAMTSGLVDAIPMMPGLIMSTSSVSALVCVFSLRRRAASKRTEAELAVSAFLDLVTILLAGGAGLETALAGAASCGDGWTFDQIRGRLASAQSARRNHWDELRRWGRECGIESVVEVANSVQIAGEHGARIRTSLVAKSRSLRARDIARIEHEAGRRTEQMGLPIVAMFMGFVVFVSYPALMGTVGRL